MTTEGICITALQPCLPFTGLSRATGVGQKQTQRAVAETSRWILHRWLSADEGPNLVDIRRVISRCLGGQQLGQRHMGLLRVVRPLDGGGLGGALRAAALA